MLPVSRSSLFSQIGPATPMGALQLGNLRGVRLLLRASQTPAAHEAPRFPDGRSRSGHDWFLAWSRRGLFLACCQWGWFLVWCQRGWAPTPLTSSWTRQTGLDTPPHPTPLTHVQRYRVSPHRSSGTSCTWSPRLPESLLQHPAKSQHHRLIAS